MTTRAVIDTIHGIHTDADLWPHNLDTWMQAEHGGAIGVAAIDWGWITGLRMYLWRLVPFWFAQRIALVADRLRETAKVGLPHSVVCHSFGNHLAVETLWRNRDITIDCFIAIGAVLGNRWVGSKLAALVRRQQVNRVLVFWSPNDWVIRDLCFWPYGKLGATGFVDHIVTTPYLKQLKTTEGHSTYFWSEFRDLYFREIAEFVLEKK